VVLGAASLSVLALVAAGSTYVLRNVAAKAVMVIGILALVAGVAISLVAVDQRSTSWFFAGTAVAGVGFGGGFQGGIRTVVPLVAAHERAGVLSLLYVVSYLGMGAPAVVAGFLVVHTGGLLDTAREYGLAVIVLATLALAGLLYPRRRAHKPAHAQVR
jgi:MFS family permease